MWNPPDLTLKWGPYTKPDPEEQKQAVETVQSALGGSNGTPVITLTMAVEKLQQSGAFDIENVSAVVDQLQAEAEEREKKARDLAKQTSAEPTEDDEDSDGDISAVPPGMTR